MRGLIYNTIKDLATKDPERTKEVLNKLKARAESLTPEERQKLIATANDLKTKALNLTDEQRARIAQAIRTSTNKPE